jgi:hypothetical protein
MQLTGDNAIHFEDYTLDKIKAVLDAGLAAVPWATRFAMCGGVQVLIKNDDAEKAAKGKRPFIYCEVASLEIDETANEGAQTRWLIEVSIEAITPAEATPFEPYLKAAILRILRVPDLFDTYAIEESLIKAGQGKNANPERINPHTFSAAVHTAD